MKSLSLSILTQEQLVSESEAMSVTIPTEEGEITVLPGHIPLFTKLKLGQLVVRHSGKEEYVAVQGGFADVGPTWVKIMADTAIKAEDINELKAKQAQEEAQRALEALTSEQNDVELRLALARAMLELKTVEKWRKGVAGR